MASIPDWIADAFGILTIYGASMIETVRKMAREQGAAELRQIAAMDRRRGRRQAVAFEPATAEPNDASSFAERAARRFPVR
jgi:hypothetical protein